MVICYGAYVMVICYGAYVMVQMELKGYCNWKGWGRGAGNSITIYIQYIKSDITTSGHLCCPVLL